MIFTIFVFGNEKGGTGKTTVAVGCASEILKIRKSAKNRTLLIALDAPASDLDNLLIKYEIDKKVVVRHERLDTLALCLENEGRANRYDYVIVDFGKTTQADVERCHELFEHAKGIIAPIIPSTANYGSINRLLAAHKSYKKCKKIIFLMNLHGHEKSVLDEMTQNIESYHREYSLSSLILQSVNKQNNKQIKILNKNNRLAINYMLVNIMGINNI